MRTGIISFPNRPGVHCASKALSDICHYYGYPWPEEIVFGLGAGLGAYYHVSSSWPQRAFVGRTLFFEEQFFRVLNIPFRYESGPALDWNRMRGWLDQGVPILVLADLQYLDFYDTVSMFGAHTMVVIGYDDADQTVLVSDLSHPYPIAVSHASFRKALGSVTPPTFRGNQWAPVPHLRLSPLEQLLRRALMRAAEQMLTPDGPRRGVTAIRAMAEDMRGWVDHPNWRKYAFLFVELCERRGSGGAAFRELYSRFLGESQALVPELVDVGAEVRMQHIAASWRQAAKVLLAGARLFQPGRVGEAAAIVASIPDAEESLFRDILAAVGGSCR